MTARARSLSVEVVGRARCAVARQTLRQWTRAILAAAGQPAPHCTVTLMLAGGRLTRALKKRYFGIGALTDVICFRYDSRAPDGTRVAEADILLCPAMIRRQASALGRGFRRECAFVLAHGLLHFLGASDDTPRRRAMMFARQEALLKRLR